MKALEFLKLGSYAILDHFLQHITELIQVKVTKDTTLNDVVQDLKEQCGERREDALQAIDSWAEYQQEGILPKTIYELFEIEENEDEDEDEDEESLYIAFNLWDKKEDN